MVKAAGVIVHFVSVSGFLPGALCVLKNPSYTYSAESGDSSLFPTLN